MEYSAKNKKKVLVFLSMLLVLCILTVTVLFYNVSTIGKKETFIVNLALPRAMAMTELNWDSSNSENQTNNEIFLYPDGKICDVI